MELLSLGKEPISTDKPTGSDVRYEPEFEELQSEIDKISSPSASGGTDWEKVGKLASEILAAKAKDLLVASYLAVAQVHTDQVEGFGVGLRVYRDLLEQFWDGLFPPKKRMRGRVAAIDWWMEKTDAAVQSLKLEPLPPERIEEFREDLRQIDRVLNDNMEDAPLLRPIERFLDSIPVLTEEKPEPEVSPSEEKAGPAAAPAQPRPTTTQLPAAPAEVGEMASVADAERVLRAALDMMRRVGAYFQNENLSNSMGYRWRRIASWSMVEALPPATNGQTIIPPPDTGIRNVLIDLKEKGNWETLVGMAEEKVPEYIFWLDLNRIVAEALTALGDPYEDAHEAVCQETGLFVHRLPGVENLCFADGTFLADPETQQWLKSIAIGGGAALSEPVSAGRIEDGDHMAEVIKNAQDLAKKKKLAEAVSSLQEELRSSFSKREQLLWRLGLCQILVNAKKPQLALPHLEAILQDIESYRLEEWDPDFALKGLKTVWVGFDAHSDQASKNKASDVLNRIAKLDPAWTIRLGKR